VARRGSDPRRGLLIGWHRTGKSRRDAIHLTGHRFPDLGDGER
jgi:hypothetical protein